MELRRHEERQKGFFPSGASEGFLYSGFYVLLVQDIAVFVNLKSKRWIAEISCLYSCRSILKKPQCESCLASWSMSAPISEEKRGGATASGLAATGTGRMDAAVCSVCSELNIQQNGTFNIQHSTVKLHPHRGSPVQ